MTEPQFSTGIEYLQASIEQASKRTFSGGVDRSYISWKPGDKKILRFLTDDLITQDFWQFIMTAREGKTQNFMVPPGDPHILDRYRSPTPGIGWRQDFKTKQLVEPKTSKIGCGIAVLRQEKLNPETGKYEIEDYLYEEEVNGAQMLHRHFGIIQQSVSNFWHTLAVSCFKRYGTICDRDYEITRGGEGVTTSYDIIPLDVDPDLDSAAKVQAFYFYGQKWDENDPQRGVKCPQTIQDWAKYFSGEERFKYWLVPEGQVAPTVPSYSPPATAVPTGLNEFHSTTTSNPAPTAVPQSTTSTSFSSFKDSILSQAKSDEAQA